MKYILSTLLLTGLLNTAAFADANGPDRNDLSGDTDVQLVQQPPVSNNGEGCVAMPETKDVPFSQLMYSKSHGHP